ncbi:hypothetical protein KUTG_05663 [Kutzneria sp. 744]|nr:hypothetical protein KUTG_05663 [Kutzneria sp. 744]
MRQVGLDAAGRAHGRRGDLKKKNGARWLTGGAACWTGGAGGGAGTAGGGGGGTVGFVGTVTVVEPVHTSPESLLEEELCPPVAPPPCPPDWGPPGLTEPESVPPPPPWSDGGWMADTPPRRW